MAEAGEASCFSDPGKEHKPPGGPALACGPWAGADVAGGSSDSAKLASQPVHRPLRGAADAPHATSTTVKTKRSRPG